MYGERYGTATLAKALRERAADVWWAIDNGEPWDAVAEQAKELMEGAMVLWERLVEEAER